MTRKASDRSQVTVILPKKTLAKVNPLLDRLSPMVSTRADILRMAFELGMEAVERTAENYEKAKKQT